MDRAMAKPPRLGIPSLVAAGACLGLADGLAALVRDADLVGGWLDRAGTLVASALAGAAALTVLVGGPRLALRRVARERQWARAPEGLAVAGTVAVLVAGPYATTLPLSSLAVAAVVGLACAAAAAAIERALGRLASRPDREPLLAAALCLGVLALAPLAAWPGLEPARAAAPRPLGLVLVSVDTLGAHHLGAYGYGRKTSPNLDRLAEQGTLFTRIFSQSPWTLPSHGTMLTGFSPLVHNALDFEDTLPDSLPTLAERLLAQGFRTAALVGGNRYSFIGAARGFDRGFEIYEHYPHPPRFRSGYLPRFVDHVVLRQLRHHVGNGEAETDAALRWLSLRGDEPFFLWLHFYDVHSKTYRLAYEAPEPWRDAFCAEAASDAQGCDAEGRCASERLNAVWAGESPQLDAEEIERLRCLYDGTIAYVDAQLGRLLEGIDRLGLRETTLVAVTSDHGEAFFEHGHPLHTHTLYDEVLQVPLILRGPGVPAGRRIDEMGGLIDLVPTLLDRLGLAQPDELQGRSLFAGGEAPADVAVASLASGAISLRLRGFKFLVVRPRGAAAAGSESLFDLRSDPGELHDLLVGSPPALAAELRERLLAEEQARRALGRRLRGDARPPATELPEQEREHLRALGYVESQAGGGASAP